MEAKVKSKAHLSGHIHIIKRMSTRFQDLEVWMKGKNVNLDFKKEFTISIKGTYSKSWENMPVLDKLCPPYVCYKGDLGEAFVMVSTDSRFQSPTRPLTCTSPGPGPQPSPFPPPRLQRSGSA